jgi:hypothetical protein
MQVFNLEHDAYCAGGECACSVITAQVLEENPRTGDRAPRLVTKRAPASLTLLARERREGLRDSITAVPEVQAAIARGLVRVVEQTAPVAPRRPSRSGKEE